MKPERAGCLEPKIVGYPNESRELANPCHRSFPFFGVKPEFFTSAAAGTMQRHAPDALFGPSSQFYSASEPSKANANSNDATSPSSCTEARPLPLIDFEPTTSSQTDCPTLPGLLPALAESNLSKASRPSLNIRRWMMLD
jgi:hypothetical protein